MFCLVSPLDEVVWINLSQVNTGVDCVARPWSTLVIIILFVSYII